MVKVQDMPVESLVLQWMVKKLPGKLFYVCNLVEKLYRVALGMNDPFLQADNSEKKKSSCNNFHISYTNN